LGEPRTSVRAEYRSRKLRHYRQSREKFMDWQSIGTIAVVAAVTFFLIVSRKGGG